MFYRKTLLVLSALSLSACGTSTRLPNGKLAPDYLNYVSLPIETKVAEIQVENPLTVKVPVTNMQNVGGGLIGALAVAAINVTSTAVSHTKRADEKEAILNSIDARDRAMYDLPGRAYAQTINNTNWIRVQEFRKIYSEDKEGFVKAGEQMRYGMDGKAFAVIGSQFVIGEEFESLTQTLRFEISSVQNGKTEKKLYKVMLSDVFYPEESMDTGFENHELWIKNNNALLRRGIMETTRNINTQLRQLLADPYVREGS